MLFILISGCETESLSPLNTGGPNSQTIAQLGEGGNWENPIHEGTIDPILATDVMATRKGILANATTETYSVNSLYQYIWDAEYYFNVDNFAPITKDRSLMEFFTWSYDLPNNQSLDFTTLAAMRSSFTTFTQQSMGSIPLPPAYVWFEIANVYAYPNDLGGTTVEARVGSGVNLGPCGNAPCPKDYEELYALESIDAQNPTGSCTYPVGQMKLYLPDFLCGTTSIPMMELARTYTNRAKLVNGSYVPGDCNPVPQAIYNPIVNVPNANVREYYIASESLPVRPDYDGISCYRKRNLWEYQESADCSANWLCIPETEAHFYLGSIGQAINENPTTQWSSSLKFYCSTNYDVIFALCGCSNGEYRSALGILAAQQ